jgi:hypothetical protein
MTSIYLQTNCNDPILNDHHKTISKTLQYDIKLAKRTHFSIKICNSKNKIETKWSVAKTVAGKRPINSDIHTS